MVGCDGYLLLDSYLVCVDCRGGVMATVLGQWIVLILVCWAIALDRKQFITKLREVRILATEAARGRRSKG